MGQILTCPKCGSSQITSSKKGFSGKKAVAGAILTGGIGLLAGTLGSNKVILTCLVCGHTFKPGQGKIKNIITPVTNFPESKKIIYKKPRKEYSPSPNLTLPSERKIKRNTFWVVIIVITIIGYVSDKAGCNKNVNGTDNIIVSPNLSNANSLSISDSIKITEELNKLLVNINLINIDPEKAIKKFSHFARQFSNSSAGVYQVFQSAKYAKQKMEDAQLEISNLSSPQTLPQILKDSLSSALSTISSSYLTMSSAFDEAMNAVKNSADKSYTEALGSDMQQATQMYAEAVSAILQIQDRFKVQQTRTFQTSKHKKPEKID